MSDNYSYVSHLDEVLGAVKEQVEAALEECGMDAEYYAKKLCPVDTGRLRNSITHATSKYAGNSEYSTNKKSKKSGKKIQQSSYSNGSAMDSPDEYTMVLGTNVEYAPIVEHGLRNRKAKAFIKPAIADHKAHYESVIARHLKGNL